MKAGARVLLVCVVLCAGCATTTSNSMRAISQDAPDAEEERKAQQARDLERAAQRIKLIAGEPRRTYKEMQPISMIRPTLEEIKREFRLRAAEIGADAVFILEEEDGPARAYAAGVMVTY